MRSRGLDQLQELHRPWIDEVTIRCEECGEEARRIPEVGDAWLDAGIVPLSTLGWQNPDLDRARLRDGRVGRPDRRRPARQRLLGAVVPGRLDLREPRADPALVLLDRLHVDDAGRPAAVPVGAHLRARPRGGRAPDAQVGRNMIEANEAFDTIGADLMRWLYCATPPDPNVNFGYGLAGEVRRRLLTLWSSAGFLVTYANIAGWRPRWDAAPVSDHPLDRWLVARTAQLANEAEEAYERFWTPSVTVAFDSFVEDLSNWYVRRSRRRFWDGDPDGADRAVVGVPERAPGRRARDAVPGRPPLAHARRRGLPRCPGLRPPRRLARSGSSPTRPCSPTQAEVRRVVELGRQARAQADINLRQPLRQMFVRGSTRAGRHVDEIADELNVKEVLFDEGPVASMQLKPNLPVLGPRLGAKLRDVTAALEAGDYEELGDGRVRAAGEELGPDDVIRGERLSVHGFVMADDDVVSVALSTELDDELRLEKRVRDLIRAINVMRKEVGLEITDRIVVTLASAGRRPRRRARRLDQAGDAGGRAPRRRRRARRSRKSPERGSASSSCSTRRSCSSTTARSVPVPRPVFEEYQRWQRELERQPVEFLARRLDGLIEEAKERLAGEIGARPDDLAFVTNATSGMNVVARSLPLASGDEVVASNHEYGAVGQLWQHVCARSGTTLVRADVRPGPELVDELWSAVTPRTRVISVSHLTSATAIRFPVEEICRRAREQGILVAVDGAHAPGQLDLDVEAVGADFYAGNCHKWLCAPKGAGFLHVRPEHQDEMVPPVVSWGSKPGASFVERFRWPGTHDPGGVPRRPGRDRLPRRSRLGRRAAPLPRSRRAGAAPARRPDRDRAARAGRELARADGDRGAPRARPRGAEATPLRRAPHRDPPAALRRSPGHPRVVPGLQRRVGSRRRCSRRCGASFSARRRRAATRRGCP